MFLYWLRVARSGHHRRDDEVKPKPFACIKHGSGPLARECAFCSTTADISGEHLWSAWMDALFPGKKRFTVKNEKGEVTAQWDKPALDWKANVVCGRCNSTWMSKIENDHAKPALTDLILDKLDIPIAESRANSIALFAFKSAVVFNHLRPVADPFFPQSARHNFREVRAIPGNVRMWMAGFLPVGKGEVQTVYHNGALPNGNRIRLYVCTYAVGHFVFQVLAARQGGFTPFAGGGRV